MPLVAVATAGVLAVLIDRDGRSIDELAPVAFDGVDPVALAETGITLVEPPPGTRPKFSAEDASAYVAEKYSSARVKDIRLAQLTYPYDKESAPKLVWAVSLDPSGRHFTCGGFDSPKTCASPRFLLQFVDANTGEPLGSVMH
jgi:hypothetical protein